MHPIPRADHVHNPSFYSGPKWSTHRRILSSYFSIAAAFIFTSLQRCRHATGAEAHWCHSGRIFIKKKATLPKERAHMWARPRPDAIPEHLDPIPQCRGRPVCDGPRRESLRRRPEKRGRGKCAWTARERPRHYLVRHMVEIPASLVSRSCSSCAGVALAMSKQVLLREDRPELLAWLTAVFSDRTSTHPPLFYPRSSS